MAIGTWCNLLGIQSIRDANETDLEIALKSLNTLTCRHRRRPPPPLTQFHLQRTITAVASGNRRI